MYLLMLRAQVQVQVHACCLPLACLPRHPHATPSPQHRGLRLGLASWCHRAALEQEAGRKLLCAVNEWWRRQEFRVMRAWTAHASVACELISLVRYVGLALLHR